MTKSQRILSCIGLLFLIVLLLATIYSYHIYQSKLPVVTICAPQNNENGCIVPKEAVYTDPQQKSYIFTVVQRDGAWGKEYFCTAQLVYCTPYDDNTVQLRNIRQLKFPIVQSGVDKLKDEKVVKLAV